ncbi:MAG: hypothetical protein H0X17_07775 [Deltaproteobacteria bacterium]|nr:hypothetical protein [Deltaproteobacteria bacterium]
MRSVSVFVISLLLTAACGGASAAKPAWPKQTEPDDDGGESLAPRREAVATVDQADDADKPAVADKPAATPTEKPAAAKPDEAKPETPATPTPAEDIVITTEEIVIEIEDE